MNAAQRSRGKHPAHRREEQLVPAIQHGGLDLPAKHRELVAKDQHLSFGVRGDPTQPENASDDRVEERVEHGGGCYENAGRRGESSFRARQDEHSP